MSNRKSSRKTSRQRKAPTDPRSEAPADVDPPARLDLRQWVLGSLKMVLGAGLVLGVAGTLAYALYSYAMTTPRFAVTEIVVEGTRRLARDEVLGAAGVEAGQNVFSLDVEAREKALVNSPWVRQARITRKLPGTVRIEIVEREPIALAVIAGQTMLVSQDAEPFKEFGMGDPHDLPVVTGLSLQEFSRDRRAELARLQDALDLIRHYEQMSIARAFSVQELHLTDSGKAILSVGDEGTALHLGQAPWKGKLLRAAEVLVRSTRKGGNPAVVFLDNEAHPERVVVRVR